MFASRCEDDYIRLVGGCIYRDVVIGLFAGFGIVLALVLAISAGALMGRRCGKRTFIDVESWRYD
jgi:hypothetical protein